MNLIPEQRELFRHALLAVLERDGSAVFGLSAATLAELVKPRGFRPVVAEVEAELAYLQDKDLVTTIAKTLSPEVKAWRITAAGRDFLAAT
ncbi:MAG TPA: hypothetical protein VMB21_02085 [Candidatus Limnocylindria bacterium]|nr:hypothetical protein [Candidatus Limnocylindria bacterium]